MKIVYCIIIKPKLLIANENCVLYNYQTVIIRHRQLTTNENHVLCNYLT